MSLGCYLNVAPINEDSAQTEATGNAAELLPVVV